MRVDRSLDACKNYNPQLVVHSVKTQKRLGLLRLNDPVRFGEAHANAVITLVDSTLFCCS